MITIDRLLFPSLPVVAIGEVRADAEHAAEHGQHGDGAADDVRLGVVDAELAVAGVARAHRRAVNEHRRDVTADFGATAHGDAEAIARERREIARRVRAHEGADRHRPVGGVLRRGGARVRDLVVVRHVYVAPRDRHGRRRHARHEHARAHVLHVHIDGALVASVRVRSDACVAAVIATVDVVYAQRAAVGHCHVTRRAGSTFARHRK